MTLSHALLLMDIGEDMHDAVIALRRAAPCLRQLTIVALAPGTRFAWLSETEEPEMSDPVNDALDSLRRDAEMAGIEVSIRLAAEPGPEALDQLLVKSRPELVVTRIRPLSRLAQVAELRKRHGVAVLWLPVAARRGGRTGAGRQLVCVAGGQRSDAVLAVFLRDRFDQGEVIRVPAIAPDLSAAAGIRSAVRLVRPGPGQTPRRWIEAQIDAGAVDLLIYAHLPVGPLTRADWPVPILLLPPPSSMPGARPRAIEASDAVGEDSGSRVRLEYAGGLGRRSPVPDQEIGVVAGGQAIARVPARDGQVRLPATCSADACGLFRAATGDGAADPLLAVEQWIAILRPGGAPLVLYDAEIAMRQAKALGGIPEGFDAVAVRMRPTRGCGAIRARLRTAGLGARVLDASTVLDEGAAFDVSDMFDAVRLARVATRLRTMGFAVAAIVHQNPIRPSAHGFAELHVDEIATHPWSAAAATALTGLGSRLDATGALLVPGNRVEIELDNRLARGWLLEAIAGSRRSVHMQVYMVADDDIGRMVEEALAQAAARGVAVRMLVDSLHGMHGSLGLRNPLLERLDARPGVDLRVSQPFAGLPSMEDIKQRDHRKLAVIDGEVALVGGRNISHEYYTGFGEVALDAESPWRQVPWLDAGARLWGPAVAVVERLFLEDWTRAGGVGFAVDEPPPAGPTPLRVVAHNGLRDARALEAYMALIETARTQVDVINGFPLILEIRHALLRALERGVRVRTLFGHLTPAHGGVPFKGPWATVRTAATELVHSRMDALIAAGAEGYRFAVPEHAGWAPGLGSICSHVHAKLLCVDRRVCAVGSANLDITASYWESELMLVVEDAAIVGPLGARIDALIAGSIRVDRDDPRWRELAERREWMIRWPGLLSA